MFVNILHRSRLSNVRCYKHNIYLFSSGGICTLFGVCESFPDYILGILIKILCYQVCLCLTWVRQTAEQNQITWNSVWHIVISVEVSCLDYSQQNAQSWLYFCLVCVFQTRGAFQCKILPHACWQSDHKAPIYSAVSLNHRAVCSLSIFLLTVSIVLIMHGACVHRALLLVLLRRICSFGLLWRCWACV